MKAYLIVAFSEENLFHSTYAHTKLCEKFKEAKLIKRELSEYYNRVAVFNITLNRKKVQKENKIIKRGY